MPKSLNLNTLVWLESDLHVYMVIMNSRGRTMNTTELAEAKNFLIWMALWVGALIVLLPALAGS